MKKLRRLWNILKVTGVDKLFVGFVFFIFSISLMLLIIEPNITNYGDALWFAFATVTTIGYGDVTALTLLGRCLTVLLGVYGILIVALIPGVLVSYYLDFIEKKSDETMGLFLEKLENLEQLSSEELQHISSQVRKHRNQLQEKEKQDE